MHRLTGIILLLVCGSGNAVTLTPDRPSDALLFPYFTATDDEQTLVSVRNLHPERGSAVRVYLRGPALGEPLLSFNLYLAPLDSWNAAITRDATGQVVLVAPDETSCTFPRFDGPIPVAAPAAEAGNDGQLVGTGYIEMFQLATSPELDLSDCEMVAARWADGGVWREDPAADLQVGQGLLAGESIVVDRVGGTSYTLLPVRLDYSKQTVVHVEPGEELPTLATIHPGNDTDPGIDFVSLPMTVAGVGGGYFDDPEINAQTRVLLFAPTRRHYRDEDGSYSEPFTEVCEPIEVSLIDRAGVEPEWSGSLALCQATELKPGLLDSVDFLPPGPPANGFFEYRFPGGVAVTTGVSGEAREGLPVFVYTIARFENGDLDGVRANYSTTLPVERATSIIILN